MLVEQTTKWGMIADGAETASQAVESIRRGEQFDIAILDLQLAGSGGIALATEIRTLPGTAMLPVILLTPLGVRADAPANARLAFAICVTKPVKPAQLSAALEQALLSPPKKLPPRCQPSRPRLFPSGCPCGFFWWMITTSTKRWPRVFCTKSVTGPIWPRMGAKPLRRSTKKYTTSCSWT